MSNLIPPKISHIIFVIVVVVVAFTGCAHQKTQRGHLFRCDWAFEYNRTPWIGLPPDSVSQEEEHEGGICGLLKCLKKDGDEKNRKGFRHHCAMNSDCTAKNPCCRTLGCGMWVDPADPTTFTTLGGTAQACGLTPFCSPQKPCRLTPNCGKPINVNVEPQTLLLTSQTPAAGWGGLSGRNLTSKNTAGNVALPNGMATIRGMNPNTVIPNGMVSGVPLGTFVSRGIVPGASIITSGGVVAAIGVATPVGTMTPVGVRMPNGVVNNNIVLRACAVTPSCTAAHPCGLTPNCGGAVAVNMVSNNATVLASALQAQGVTGGVMQAGGMGMLVNPMTNQPINGLTMSGYPQVGYPPIGYAPTGYAPGYPRFATGLIEAEEPTEEVPEEEMIHPETRSQMPVPRFHPIPSKPTFQRSEGMQSTPKVQRTIAKPTTVAMTEQREVSEKEFEAALDQAYLEGVSAAMDEVERKLDAKRQSVAKAKLQEKILQQAENVRQQLDAQEEMRILAVQREREFRQQASAEKASEPKRLPSPQQAAVTQNVSSSMTVSKPKPAQVSVVAVKTSNSTNSKPMQLAENLKTSVVTSVSDVFAPILRSNQKESLAVKPQDLKKPTTSKQRLVTTQPNLPGRPPVSPVAPDYGLQPYDEPGSLILQAQFTDDDVLIRP